MRAVLGIDGCKAGWVGVLWAQDGATSVKAALDIETLIAIMSAQCDVEAVAVDIPMALSDGADRAPDALARGRVRGRASTVFNSPALAALNAATYAEANEANKSSLGKGLSRQAFALLPKISEVHELISSGATGPIIEVHPEVCFAALQGWVVLERKKSAAGEQVRRTLLREAGLDISIERVKGAATDDILDAGAAAWTARRFVEGCAERLPDEPREDLYPAIWV